MPAKYMRVANCCPYKPENALIENMGMSDQYQITYLNAQGIEGKAIVYVSFYDYEEPQILYGFRSVSVK